MFLTVILPLPMYPLFFLATTQLAVTKVQEIESEDVTVAVVGGDVPAELHDNVSDDDHLRFEAMVEEVASEKLVVGDVAAVLVLPAEFDAVIHGKLEAEITLCSTPHERHRAREKTGRAPSDFLSDRIVTDRPKAQSLSPQFIRPFEVAPKTLHLP